MEKPLSKPVRFLDLVIVHHHGSDGFVLVKDGCSHANHDTLQDAMLHAVIQFMLDRPEDFSHGIFQRLLGRNGTHLEWFTFAEVCEKEDIAIPNELTGTDNSIHFKGRPLNEYFTEFILKEKKEQQEMDTFLSNLQKSKSE